MKNWLIKEIDLSLVNNKFPEENLKGRKKTSKRERISCSEFGLSGLKYLHKNCSCVQKIFYSTGSNAYYLYAPLGFTEFIALQTDILEKESIAYKEKIAIYSCLLNMNEKEYCKITNSNEYVNTEDSIVNKKRKRF